MNVLWLNEQAAILRETAKSKNCIVPPKTNEDWRTEEAFGICVCNYDTLEITLYFRLMTEFVSPGKIVYQDPYTHISLIQGSTAIWDNDNLFIGCAETPLYKRFTGKTFSDKENQDVLNCYKEFSRIVKTFYNYRLLCGISHCMMRGQNIGLSYDWDPIYRYLNIKNGIMAMLGSDIKHQKLDSSYVPSHEFIREIII